MGQEGFCTYYPDDVFDINYETVTMKQMLGYSVSLSVAPFAVMFVLLAAGSTVLLCAKSRGMFKYFGYFLWNLSVS